MEFTVENIMFIERRIIGELEEDYNKKISFIYDFMKEKTNMTIFQRICYGLMVWNFKTYGIKYDDIVFKNEVTRLGAY